MRKKIISGIPNTCTLLNGACGIVALMIAVFYKTHEAVQGACIFIMIGAFFDTIDGRLARRLKVSSDLGKQLDSFADLITFGIAPISIFLSLKCIGNQNNITIVEIIIAAIYISCAMYRLARYNVSEHVNYFMGLPTTSSGLILSLYTFISNFYVTIWEGSLVYIFGSYLLIIFLGLAMISKIKVMRI